MNLATHYVEATEWNLATLSELCMLKSSSQARINRQTSICRKMLQVCQEWEPEIDWNQAHPATSSRLAPRVYNLLKAAKEEPEGLEGALIRWRRERAG
jgi:hypothetical protein